jgi:hypothetical protein
LMTSPFLSRMDSAGRSVGAAGAGARVNHLARDTVDSSVTSFSAEALYKVLVFQDARDVSVRIGIGAGSHSIRRLATLTVWPFVELEVGAEERPCSCSRSCPFSSTMTMLARCGP